MRWTDAEVEARVRLTSDGRSADAEIVIRAATPRILDRVKFGIVLGEACSSWSIPELDGPRDFPPSSALEGRSWAVEGPAGRGVPLQPGFEFAWPSGEIEVTGATPSFPSLRFRFSGDGIALLPVVQAACQPGVAVSAYVPGPLALEKQIVFRLSARIVRGAAAGPPEP